MLETSVGSIESAALHYNKIPRSEYFIILLTIKFGSSHSIVVGLLIRMLLKLHIPLSPIVAIVLVENILTVPWLARTFHAIITVNVKIFPEVVLTFFKTAKLRTSPHISSF